MGATACMPTGVHDIHIDLIDLYCLRQLAAPYLKMAKDMDFKFGMYAPGKGAWPGSRDAIIFWVLNAIAPK